MGYVRRRVLRTRLCIGVEGETEEAERERYRERGDMILERGRGG